ncbi:MAG: HdeD family acid-resistance protein [Leptolyngbyaceae cyanobacterium bins.349]|nr:HdeD family acid-resistance protein [Leptolyngbyaceae cyanobacterium bins.349]
MMTAEEQQVELRKSSGWLIALSIILIVLGIVALFVPVFASVTFTLVMGWILLFTGVVQIIKSFRSRPVRGFWLNLVVGAMYAIAGLLILFNPIAGTLTLTAILGTLFIVEGIYTIIMAFKAKTGGEFSWLVLANGIITLILGILVWNRFPFSALWLIGVYVGISILMSGFSLLVISLTARKKLAAI